MRASAFQETWGPAAPAFPRRGGPGWLGTACSRQYVVQGTPGSWHPRLGEASLTLQGLRARFCSWRNSWL